MAKRWFQTWLKPIAMPAKVHTIASSVPTRFLSTGAIIVRNTHVWYKIK